MPERDHDHLFYLTLLVNQYWMWLPAFLAGICLALAGANRRPELLLLLLFLASSLFGLSVAGRKNDWYFYLNWPALAMVSAWCLYRLWGSSEKFWKRLPAACAGIAVLILCLSSMVPRLFQYPRPDEKFFDAAGKALGERLSGEGLADCAGLSAWHGPILMDFYLGVHRKDCGAATPYRVVRWEGYAAKPGDELLFAESPYALVRSRVDR
jgi:hypothetical protein